MSSLPPNILRTCLTELSSNDDAMILVKQKNGVFKVNSDFKSDNSNIQIPTIIETSKQTYSIRKLIFEAAIVRTMKSNKKMLHNELLNQVMNEIGRFYESPKDTKLFKACVESLISREYMRRIDDSYEYIP